MQIDISHTMKELYWTPPYTVEESFKKINRE